MPRIQYIDIHIASLCPYIGYITVLPIKRLILVSIFYALICLWTWPIMKESYKTLTLTMFLFWSLSILKVTIALHIFVTFSLKSCEQTNFHVPIILFDFSFFSTWAHSLPQNSFIEIGFWNIEVGFTYLIFCGNGCAVSANEV